jgi:hypothetical protein
MEAGASCLAIALLESHAVWTRRACGKSRVKVELESRVEHEVFVRHLRHMDDVIPFRVDFSGVILIQKIV